MDAATSLRLDLEAAENLPRFQHFISQGNNFFTT